MANSTSVKILADGPKNTVLEFLGSLDTSDLASTIVVNLANQYRDPVGNALGVYRVDKVDFDVDDPIAVNLWWGGVPTRFESFSGRGILDVGSKYGGIQDNEDQSVRDGRILATTTGYVSGTVTFTLIMWLVKQAFSVVELPNGFILMEDGTSFILLEGTGKVQLE